MESNGSTVVQRQMAELMADLGPGARHCVTYKPFDPPSILRHPYHSFLKKNHVDIVTNSEVLVHT